MTTKRWILLFLCVALLCAAGMIAASFLHKGPVVVISQNGEVIHSIDLSSVAEPYNLTVNYNGKENTIRITPETVWVSYADCDNQICVNHGPLLESGSPITCLPNRLIIRWSKREIDG